MTVIGPLQYFFYHSIPVDRFLSGAVRVRVRGSMSQKGGG